MPTIHAVIKRYPSSPYETVTVTLPAPRSYHESNFNLNQFKRSLADQGITYVANSHDLKQAERYAENLNVLELQSN